MTDADPTVPNRICGWIRKCRRLHLTENGLTVGTIGPGAIARDGTISITGTISAGGFKIFNFE